MPTRPVTLAAAVGLLAVLTACSSADGTSVATSATSASPTPAASAGADRASAAVTSGARPAAQVLPATGLRDGQSVEVTGTGFGPGRALIAVLCADNGAATGPADCDLERMASVTADGQGRVRAKLALRKGPFGSGHVVCGGGRTCLVTITEAAQPPQQQAAVPVTFA